MANLMAMQHDPWLLQVAALSGESACSPSHWRAVQRHVVSDFAQGQSARYRPGTAPGERSDAARMPPLRDVSDLALVDHLRHAGPLTMAQLAMLTQTAHPVAWERMHGLARRGLVRRVAGAWSAVLLGDDAAHAA